MSIAADLEHCQATIAQAVKQLQAQRDDLLFNRYLEREALARTIGNLIAANEALERARPFPP